MPVVLGTVAFLGFEAPEEIPFGGKQALAIHRAIGGLRTVDSMGPDDEPLAWKGRFRGPIAVLRARQIDLMRRAGRPHILVWSAFCYRVVIQSFEANFSANNEIPYSISCVVIQDLIADVVGPLLDRVESAITTGLSDATGLAVGSPVLTGIVTGAQAAVASVATNGRLDLSTVGQSALAGAQAGAGVAVAGAAAANTAAQGALSTSNLTAALSGPVTDVAGQVRSTVAAADTAYRSNAVQAALTTVRDNLGRAAP